MGSTLAVAASPRQSGFRAWPASLHFLAPLRRRGPRPGLAADISASVNGAFRAISDQDGNDPFDLPPAAEVDDIAKLPASVGSRCRLADRMNPVTIDQLGGLDGRRSVGKMNMDAQHSTPLLPAVEQALGDWPFKRRHGHAQQDVNHEKYQAMGGWRRGGDDAIDS